MTQTSRKAGTTGRRNGRSMPDRESPSGQGSANELRTHHRAVQIITTGLQHRARARRATLNERSCRRDFSCCSIARGREGRHAKQTPQIEGVVLQHRARIRSRHQLHPAHDRPGPPPMRRRCVQIDRGHAVQPSREAKPFPLHRIASGFRLLNLRRGERPPFARRGHRIAQDAR